MIHGALNQQFFFQKVYMLPLANDHIDLAKLHYPRFKERKPYHFETFPFFHLFV